MRRILEHDLATRSLVVELKRRGRAVQRGCATYARDQPFLANQHHFVRRELPATHGAAHAHHAAGARRHPLFFDGALGRDKLPTSLKPGHALNAMRAERKRSDTQARSMQ